MTVCVAALGIAPNGAGLVFGASDRMLTGGDVEFEPEQSKHWVLTRSIVAMSAGDAAFQSEIMVPVDRQVSKRVASEPSNWWLIEDVARLYAAEYVTAAARYREADILAPLGLTTRSFLTEQGEMEPSLVNRIATELLMYELPQADILFVGTDPEGAHIYQVWKGHVYCQDTVGFAATGAGGGHARSHLMFQRHNRWKPLPETMLSTYFAKKRGEIAPGVGAATDMFLIGPGLGTYAPLNQRDLDSLHTVYSRHLKAAGRADERSRQEAADYVRNAIAAAARSQGANQAPPPGDGGTPTDAQLPPIPPAPEPGS